MKKRLKYALIGCGRIATNHLRAYVNNIDDLELCALCDIVPENVRLLLSRTSVEETPTLYTDYRELLKIEQPDVVAIATESGLHAEIAIASMNAGAHVIVEKPFALSMRDAREMLAVQKRNDVVLYPCHQNRFNKSIEKIRSALDAGKFGRLLYGTAHIRWNRGTDYYAQASWRGTWAQDGGALMNQCIHNIDLLRWLMGGSINEVFAYTGRLAHDYIEGEDFGAALIKFSNGAYGIIEGTTNVYSKNLEETLYIFGENGTAKAGGASVNRLEAWRFADEDENAVIAAYGENPPNVYGFGHTKLYTDVVATINGIKSPLISAQEGLEALELVLAIYKSQKEGIPVKLPLENFSTEDMIGIF